MEKSELIVSVNRKISLGKSIISEFTTCIYLWIFVYYAFNFREILDLQEIYHFLQMSFFCMWDCDDSNINIYEISYCSRSFFVPLGALCAIGATKE